MSEENQTNQGDSTTQVEIIMPSAIVEIKMSTGYYQKIQEIVGFLVLGKTNEEMQNAHTQIKEQSITEDWINHYETILILCREFEMRAKEQGFIQSVSLDEAKKLLGESEED